MDVKVKIINRTDKMIVATCQTDSAGDLYVIQRAEYSDDVVKSIIERVSDDNCYFTNDNCTKHTVDTNDITVYHRYTQKDFNKFKKKQSYTAL